MANAVERAWNACLMTLVRPYLWRELPGWGPLYSTLIGSYRSSGRWSGYPVKWVRGKLHGYEMPIDLAAWSNRQTYFLGRYYDAQNQLVVKAFAAPGDTVVDIGGNEGMIALLAAHVVGPGGKVIMFEPNPGPRSKMEQSLARNGIDWVDLRPVGLSDAPATLTLSIPLINWGEASFGHPAYGDGEMETIEARVAVGDEELAGEMPRLIKIDVEGFEVRVLRGLRETLARARPIVTIEIVTRHLANAGSTPAEVAAELQGLGYKGWGLGLTGRGAGCRVRLQPNPSFEGDVRGDFLWVHPEDPRFPEIEARLARTGL